jgi:hypothetical protein
MVEGRHAQQWTGVPGGVHGAKVGRYHKSLSFNVSVGGVWATCQQISRGSASRVREIRTNVCHAEMNEPSSAIAAQTPS